MNEARESHDGKGRVDTNRKDRPTSTDEGYHRQRIDDRQNRQTENRQRPLLETCNRTELILHRTTTQVSEGSRHSAVTATSTVSAEHKRATHTLYRR